MIFIIVSTVHQQLEKSLKNCGRIGMFPIKKFTNPNKATNVEHVM